MNRKNRVLTVVLALVFTLASVQMAPAKDAADYYNEKPANIRVNETISSKIEKLGDRDCFTFVSGGGRYSVLVYSKKVEKESDIYDFGDEFEDLSSTIIPIDVEYGAFEYFSAAAGDPPEYQIGSTISYTGVEAKPDKNGWYVGKIDIEKYRSGMKVGISFTGGAKGPYAYKFKVVGKNSPSSGKTSLTRAKGKKASIALKWKKAKGAKGYQIQIAKDENFTKGSKTYTVKGGKTLSKTLKKIKKGTYFVRVCSYKKVTDVKCCSKWSAHKKVQVK